MLTDALSLFVYCRFICFFYTDMIEKRVAFFQFEANMPLGYIACHVEKTVPESIDWLSRNEGEILHFSLDNDLYVPEYHGDAGEGWKLCEWILANLTKHPLQIHSTNIHAADKMRNACNRAGWECRTIPPYNGFEWIHESKR